MSKKNKTIYLIYPRAHRETGSTIMRTFQLHQILKDRCEENIEVLTLPISNLRLNLFWKFWITSFKSEDILIFCKDAIDRIPVKFLEKIQSTGATIAIDYIDKVMASVKYKSADIHIASSDRQYSFLNSIYFPDTKIVYLPHLGDLRLYKMKQPLDRNDKIFYLGELQNTYIPESFINHVDIVPYNGKVSTDTLKQIQNYKYQYCIRQPHQNTSIVAFKPLTKVMNSIAMSIPPIVSYDLDGITSLLGREYPFMIHSYEEREFNELLEKLNDSALYQVAVTQMLHLIELYNPEKIAKIFFQNFH